MKVALVYPFYTERVTRPEEVLNAYPIVRCLPQELAALGHEVRVILQSPANAFRRNNAVRYEFVAASRPVQMLARSAFRWKPTHGPAYYELVPGLGRAIARFDPDVVHFAGLTMDVQLGEVARLCRRRGIPLVVDFHGGLPATGRRRWLQRHNMARIDRALFTTREQAEPWVTPGLLPGWDRATTIMETSSAFTRIPRHEARQMTDMTGDPVCVSVGRLHPIKDPLTMLRGFARFANDAPNARLYLYYLTDELISEARELIASIPAIQDRIVLRGRASPDQMAAIYSSADLLLQASTREWSGLAVLEAMSCGCVPVVTDIPSFRTMTGNGRYGRLFPVGDSDALANALRDLCAGNTSLVSSEVEAHFHAELSFGAIARQLDGVYRDVRGTSDSTMHENV